MDDPRDLENLLRRLPRRRAPDVPLERVLDRWTARRRRTYALAAGLATAAVLGLSAAIWEPAPPPVHLEVRVVDVTTFGHPLPDAPNAIAGQGLEEIDLP